MTHKIEIHKIVCVSRKVSVVNYMELYTDLWNTIYKSQSKDCLIVRI